MLRALRFSSWVRTSLFRPRLVLPAKARRAVASNVMTPLSLSYTVFDGPSPQPPLVFLHGLFGSKNNFQSLAKKLVLQTGRQVCEGLGRLSWRCRCCLLRAMRTSGSACVTPLASALNAFRANLVSSEGQFKWRVNLEAISHHLDELLSFPDFQTPYLGPTLFLGGTKSQYISSNDYPEIERLFPEAEIQYVPDAGHWVHADQPQQFLAAVCNFLELPPP